MSKKALSRAEVLALLINKKIRQKEAAQRLGLCVRQVKRLLKKYRALGARGLVSARIGQPSNHRFPAEKRTQIEDLLSKKYYDFGPTFATEKIIENHDVKVSKETTRQIMIASGIWEAHPAKVTKPRPRRIRRSRFGELVQIDGSPHHWFGKDQPSCCLIVFVDDATSRIIWLQFVPTETTAAYFDGLSHHIRTYGRPFAYYSDKHSIFRVNQPGSLIGGKEETQFGRALKTLGIELICAHSPQAKGRVERLNATLQDRLVRELRLRGITEPARGNAYLPDYIKAHNERFGVEPANPEDAHRQDRPDEATLAFTLTKHSSRKLSKNLELSYNGMIYQLQLPNAGYRLQGADITVSEAASGAVRLFYRGKEYPYTIYPAAKKTCIKSDKALNQAMDSFISRSVYGEMTQVTNRHDSAPVEVEHLLTHPLETTEVSPL